MATGQGGGHGIGTRGGRRSARRRAIGGGASGRDGDTPSVLEEEEAGFLQLEVSSISPCTPLISRGCRLLFCFLVDRVTPIVPTLAPAKVLRSRVPATIGRRSARVP
jgi:hypothetical protein